MKKLPNDVIGKKRKFSPVLHISVKRHVLWRKLFLTKFDFEKYSDGHRKLFKTAVFPNLLLTTFRNPFFTAKVLPGTLDMLIFIYIVLEKSAY